MKFKMAENSLFAILLRSRWWVSLLVSLVVGVIGHWLLPANFRVIGYSIALPFFVIAVMAAWKQRHQPGAARIEATQNAVREMSWREFSGLLEKAFAEQGYTVSRESGAVDLTLVKGSRTTLVAAKRWKAASHGVDPLRELIEEKRKRVAEEAKYVCVGEMTDNARRFAAEHRIALIEAAELAAWLKLPRPAR